MPQKIHLINGEAHPDNQPLSKKRKDTALWISHDTAYIVDFGADSPFEQNAFFVAAKGSEPSGKLKDDVEEREYPYELTQVSNAKLGKAKVRKKKAKRRLSGAGPDVEILP